MVDPSWTTETNRVGCFEGTFRSAVAADWVVAISEATRSHYLSVFPHFPEDRIRVVYPCSRFRSGDDSGHRPAALSGLTPGRFWLSVGTIEPRKNQSMLARAYARSLALGAPDMPLVLAGGKGWKMEGFRDELQSLGIADRVVMTGYVTDEALVWLYRNCRAHLYASSFEGFGLPILEGMQFGAATVACDATAMPEVVGEGGVLLPPDEIEAWAGTMARLASDERELAARREAALARAARFEAKASAKRLLDLYEEAVREPKRRASPQPR